MQGLSVTGRDPGLPPPEIQIYLLGPPRVEWHSKPLAIPRSQARALLYRLATEPRPIPRETLCFLFWPDTSEGTAWGNLSRLVSMLHHALPLPEALVTAEDQIGLDRQLVQSDAHFFRQLRDDWKTTGDIASLRYAADLFDGPFLAGFSLPSSREFETWAATEREYWNRMILEVLTALVEDQATKREVASAIGYAQRYLAIDSLSEEIHRRLIELYALAGDRAAALRQYEQCLTVLERELGVDPLPETQAIYRAVLRGQMPYQVSPTVMPAAAALPAVNVPMFGRKTSLDRLEAAFASIQSGHSQVILLSGEPGIGKSRLMHEFAARVQHQALVLIGACYAETQGSPYQPIIETLRPWLNMTSLALPTYPEWLAEIAQLWPELRAAHPGLAKPPPSEPGWARTRLFEALAMLTMALAGATRPVVWCLDDLHWADPATLDWLVYLAHRRWARPLLVLGTCRREDADKTTGLAKVLYLPGAFYVLTLDGLDRTAMVELLQYLDHELGQDDAVTDRLSQITGGNPFFLLEMLQALRVSSAGLRQPTVSGDIAVPASVQLLVRTRVHHLGEPARQVVEGAAVLGRVFSFNAVTLTAGRPEMETVSALEELVMHDFLVEEEGRYRFRHELVQEAVYQGISHQRRRLLHRRAGEVLKTLNPADSAALARHFERADQPGQAARHALQAGLAARKVHAHVQARLWSDRALTLLEREIQSLRDPQALAANLRARIEALGLRGWALRLVGDMTAYVHDLEEESRLVEQLGDPATLAHLRRRQARAHCWFCRYEQALDAAEEGVRLSQNVGSRYLEGLCWREAGLALRALGDYDQAEAAMVHALNLLDKQEQAGLRVHVLGNLSTLNCFRGDCAQGITLARQALALCEEAGLAQERRIALGDLGAAAAALGDTIVARQCLVESLAIAGQVSDHTQEIFCLGHLGWLDVQEQRTDQAIDHLQAALALAQQINSCAEQPWLHAGLAMVLWLTGDPDTARNHAQQAIALADTIRRAYDQHLARQVLDQVTAR